MDFALLKRAGNRWHAAAVLSAAALALPVQAADTQSRDKDLPAFTQVTVEIPAEVRIRQSGKSHVNVTAEPALLEKIDVSVNGSVLKVAARGSFSTQQPLVVEIDTRALKRLEMNAAGNVTVDGVRGDQLAVVAAGSGDVKLSNLNLKSLLIDSQASGTITSSGRATQQEVRVGGSGAYQGEQTETERSVVDLSGAGNVTVWATKSLQAKVDGSGMLRYRGKPQVKQDIAGAGSIEQF
ncbi:MAG TPA: head GIN domain-containing protein [Noviherbaspirillum sp.]|uniref:head GIN domain-containing protein n=1 Tax=Noviherbaspirillum sp. TaxID=1926288 RepID=UPI002D66EA4E|nr:head GIN domain-containing protein [Noviherbaspirillum sp.]HYD97514.1 head GIN domain-containing protein [Noviherbaspirillum sp.]